MDSHLLGKKLDLLLLTGQLLIQSLADSNRVDRNLRRIAVFMGIPEDRFHMHIMYTTLMINISEGSRSITKFRKCQNHSANMTVLSEISKLSWKALEQKYSLEQYETELNRIASFKKNYPRWLVITAVGVACGGFCKLFGCDWPAVLITFVASSIALFARQEMHHRQFNPYINVAISSFIAVLISCSSTFLPISDTPYHPIFASVLFLIPGFPLINSLDDMIDGFTIVGVTRMVIAFLTIAAIAFGMFFALKILNFNDYTTSLIPYDPWFLVALFAAFAATGFAILFNVPTHTLLVCALLGAIAVTTRNLLFYHLGWGLALSSFCGSLTVGMASIYLVHKVHVPAHVISIPPIIPMVPGVLMYQSIIGAINFNANAPEIDQLPILIDTFDSLVKVIMILFGLSLGIAIPNIAGRIYTAKLKQKRITRALAA
ncbi:MAG: threonine/serine exporter family protein [Bacteroidales bacterium]|jgi:uncharacterized membrane protein YjjP (DUF1212 family)|nr:threonine/serine exporter family protein [Bacteroidales bacterium]